VNKIGPSLAGVVGRKSGSAPGFNCRGPQWVERVQRRRGIELRKPLR
jgi:cytochrome c2